MKDSTKQTLVGGALGVVATFLGLRLWKHFHSPSYGQPQFALPDRENERGEYGHHHHHHHHHGD